MLIDLENVELISMNVYEIVCAIVTICVYTNTITLAPVLEGCNKS